MISRKNSWNEYKRQAGQYWEKIRPMLEYLGFGQRRCAHCKTAFFPGEGKDRDLAPTLYLCPDCRELIKPYTGFRCAYCGLPTGFEMEFEPISSETNGLHICRACARSAPNWTRLSYYGLYAGPLRDMLLRYKFDGELSLGHALGEFLLMAACSLPRPDALVAVPQHDRHLAERGYNQALELAKELARLTDLPLRNLLRRVRQGSPQEHLGAAQRKANLLEAFRADSGVAKMHIWLVDDVMTTGSTAMAACKALYAAGCREVSVLFVARTTL